MIKLLYKLFPKQLNSIVFENTTIHGNWKDKCYVHYIDTLGNKYYTPKNLFEDLWVKRREYLENLLALNEAGFSREDKKLWITNSNNLIDGIVNDVEKKGKIDLKTFFQELARLRTMNEMLEARFEVILEPDTLLSMMACILVREDEDPAIISDPIVDKHVEQFKKDDKLRDSAFFLTSGLDLFMPYLKGLEENWDKYIQDSTKTLKTIKQTEKKVLEKIL
jgi:hypothetical protein